ncbi:hypothetical protein [Streptomyces sp. NPDC051211]|uniref:hypothetical protein n=1 Tax=Streptomyces sp. NPDC051211 TaxID=3154643 RepID=UPI00344EEE68
MSEFTARFSREVGQAIKSLADPGKADLQAAVRQACADPYSWPQADKYELDETVRVISTPTAIVHYVIIPGMNPHLWIFAITF